MSKKYAYLVGISDYGDQGKDLNFCKNDVNKLAEVLSRKGFLCTTSMNEKIRDVVEKDEFKNFLSQANDINDVAIFYFSGHGLDIAGEQILLGKSVNTNNMGFALENEDLLILSDLIDHISNIKSQKIIIIDACRTSLDDSRVANYLHTNRTKAIQGASNCAIVFSSADGKKSYGTPDNTNSRFTEALINELKKYRKNFLEIISETIHNLEKYNDGINQTPWVYSSLKMVNFDGYAIKESKLDRDSCPPIKHINGDAKKGVTILTHGSNKIVRFSIKSFLEIATIPQKLVESLICFDKHQKREEYIFIRKYKKTVTHVRVEKNSKNNNETKSRHIHCKDLESIFGGAWTPDGDEFFIFGKPKKDEAGIRIINSKDKSKTRITGLPIDVECNAAAWLERVMNSQSS